ncbi:MAG: hypothetical protein HYX47_11170 [Burkholderiales bacterium]|nr:hypothetical protein [Burkholderiales bacterium]
MREAGRQVHRQPDQEIRRRSLKDLLLKGIVLVLIGAGVLVSPAFIQSPGLHDAVAGSAVVGWFSLALGIAFLGQWAWRRRRK